MPCAFWETSIETVPRLLWKKPSAIIFTPVDYKAMVPGVEKINAAKIPVVNITDRSAGGVDNRVKLGVFFWIIKIPVAFEHDCAPVNFGAAMKINAVRANPPIFGRLICTPLCREGRGGVEGFLHTVVGDALLAIEVVPFNRRRLESHAPHDRLLRH